MEISKIIWNTEKRKIKDLKDYDRNPRRIGKKEFDQLVDSIKNKGYHELVRINQDGIIISGHQRLKAMLKSGYKHDNEIEVRVPERQLTPEEFREEVVKANLHSGVFDYDMLANDYEISQLIDYGLSQDTLEGYYEEPIKEKKNKEPKKCPNCGSDV